MSVETVNFTTVNPENWPLELRCQNYEARTPEQDCVARPRSQNHGDRRTVRPRVPVTPELCGCGKPETRTISTEYVSFTTAKPVGPPTSVIPYEDGCRGWMPWMRGGDLFADKRRARLQKNNEFSGPLVVSNQSQALITSSPSAKPQITLAVTPLRGR